MKRSTGGTHDEPGRITLRGPFGQIAKRYKRVDRA